MGKCSGSYVTLHKKHLTQLLCHWEALCPHLPWRYRTMAHIHPGCSLCLKLEERSFPKPQISQCRTLAASAPSQKQSSFSQMVGQPVCYCRGLEEAEGRGRQEGSSRVQWVFISETHTTGIHSVSLALSAAPPSVFLSAMLSVSVCFSVSPCVWLPVVSAICLVSPR